VRFVVRSREVQWRWFGRVQLTDGPLLLLTGDVARWIFPGEEVSLLQEQEGDRLEFEGFVLRRGRVLLWPPWREEVTHPRTSWSGRSLYAYRLVAREAMYERDYEAIVELEQFHYASEHEVVALWRCAACGRITGGNYKPTCACGSEMRLLEIKGSTPASRFLVLELAERLPFEPRILGYLRVDPPIPRMHRRTREGIEPNVRERVFPASWFHPTFSVQELLHEAPEELAEADWRTITEIALERVNTAAARIARVVVHPDYRADGLGALLVRLGLRWIAKRRIPEMRRPKHLVETVAQMARYHPFFERVGFRYGWETASGRPVLLYPLTPAATQRLEAFLATDPEAREHGGRLYRPRYGRVQGLSGPLVLRGVRKAYANTLDLARLSGEVRCVLEAFGVQRRRLERAVLRDVHLTFPPGSVSVLWGASGAGKTVLLRLLLGEAPDGGEILRPEGRVRAFLPGEAEPQVSGAAVLEQAYARLQDITAAIEVLNRVGLADAVLYRARPRELSTGQRERFWLALLLAERPDLLLLDEFAAHLDGATAQRVARGLGRFVREAGITLVAATHRPEVLDALEPDQVVYVGYGSVWSARPERSTQSIRPGRSGTGMGRG